jgi:hypothetical protein
MQVELSAESLALPVQILGINSAGHEAGNTAICAGRDLPWLQQPAGVSVWTELAEYRDVVIVDAANEKVVVYNLTPHNLAIAENYEELKGLLRASAAP